MISDKDDSLESSIEDEEINFLNVCSVCGYQKGKNNYGAFTCSSCKVFFRRNADLDLVC
jgi:transposase